MANILDLDTKKYIIIKGAQLHNLKHVDAVFPRNEMTVVTGLSGSGKSSLVFDTLYAEGQRRYVESLSSYARQFMGKLNKPKVDEIKGIAPAIAVEQKVSSSNPRSTVGTKTEIYDYLRLLYARIGKTFSPISGKQVKSDSVKDVLESLKNEFTNGEKLLLLAPINDPIEKRNDRLGILKQQGFARIFVNGEVLRIEEITKAPKENYALVVDRIIVRQEEDFYQRVADAIEIAFYEGKGACALWSLDQKKEFSFSNLFELDGMSFVTPNIHFFSFNNPFGACKKCEGFGDIIGIDSELVVPDTSRSIFDDAIAPWRGAGMRKFHKQLIENAYKFDFPIHKPYYQLSEKDIDTLWEGNSYFTGINKFFKKIEAKNYKIQNRVLLSRYRGKTACYDCEGSRLRKDTNHVKIGGEALSTLLHLPIDELGVFFNKLKLNAYDSSVSSRILKEIKSRIQFIQDVGLGYLNLNRKANSLSGGESQRINLATSLGSALVGSMYILDEPSIGLHSRDNERLIMVLKKLRDLGNTVIVVEHDEEIMNSADKIIDMGPEAGTYGGEIVAEGDLKGICESESLTAKYLRNEMAIPIPSKRRKSRSKIILTGNRENNLKNIDVEFPLGCMTVVTGVSGSGKSTLVKKILYPALQREKGIFTDKPGQYDAIKAPFEKINSVEFVDQNPIGRSSRSNPVTYIKAYDEIRNLYAKQPLSKNRAYQAKHFSFNVDGGRCDHCKGDGNITIEMQFMADVVLQCEYCKGKRFKKEILEVDFRGVSLDQLLEMSVDNAIEFFEKEDQTKMVQKLKPLQDVGLGYVALGQPSTTLSGGEAQRIKLASFIGRGTTKDKIVFIFDEPTTGLHFHDINKLLLSFNALIEQGHTVIVVEHNLDLIKCADQLIDLGPEGGKNGGELLAMGTPEEVALVKSSFTGQYLSQKLSL
ncbi:MAG: excinuclease ABC subunit UvrA [Flavobacteriaceae bacterium]|nr:excinuclease ABC subunit UvrA [Flavobacteriaceae bacterium]